MAGISLVNVDAAVGLITGGEQNFVLADGNPISVVGDKVAPHAPLIAPHLAATMTGGSDFVFIEGSPVIRAGDPATCKHVATGQAWIREL